MKNMIETNTSQGRQHLQTEGGKCTESDSGGSGPIHLKARIKTESVLGENIKRIEEKNKVDSILCLKTIGLFGGVPEGNE